MTSWLLLAVATSIATSSTAPTAVSVDPFGPKGLKFATADGAYSLKLALLLQPQWTYVAADGDDTHTFRVRRSELGIGGTFFAPNVKWKLKVAFDLPNRAGGVSARMLDAALDWQIIPEIGIAMGQFKSEFSYENLTTTGTNLLVDRSSADGVFGLDRDIGVSVHGVLFENYFEYALYLMNGDLLNNTNKNLTVYGGGRLVVNFLGRVALAQSDLDISESPNLSLGFATVYDRRNAALASRVVRMTADLAFLWRGFAFLGVGHALLNTTKDTQDYGFVAQAGYCIWPKHLEIAVRGTGIFREEDSYEAAIGLNGFVFGHGLSTIV
jgi:hypothetical protein